MPGTIHVEQHTLQGTPHRYGVSGTRPPMHNVILNLSLHKGYKSKITTVARERQAQYGAALDHLRFVVVIRR